MTGPAIPQRSRPIPALLLVIAGGALGTLARYGLGMVVPSPGGLPVPTFLINLSGAFLLGWLLEALSRTGPDDRGPRALRLLAGTGFLGAFTTYSGLAGESLALLEAGRTGEAGAYLAATLCLGLLASAAGILAATRFSGPKAEPHAQSGARNAEPTDREERQ